MRYISERRRSALANISNLIVISFAAIGFITTLQNVQPYVGISGLGGRYMSQNLGDGNCEWSPPVDDTEIENPSEVQATLIAGFPGVGKRLVWGLVEQLTNRKIGDDWNLGELGDNVVAMKTSYPHPEGNWTWGDSMYQTIIVLRNPMQTFIDYHNIKEEIKPAQNVEDMKKLNKTETVFSEEADISKWYTWRDAAFDRQMDLYGWFIEYWMDDGRRRNDGTGEVYYESKCAELMAGTCIPKAIVQYEALLDHTRSDDEVIKIGTILADSVGVPVIDQSVWSCTYREVMKRDTFYSSKKRATSGEEKTYSHKQLGTMRRELERLRDKYSNPVYDGIPVAAQLINILDDYIVEVVRAYQVAWNIHATESVSA